MIIKRAIYIISSPSYDKCPKSDKPEYAFIGRSNVGKSSLINMLCNNQRLAKTSVNPGKTQLINHFEIEATPLSQNGEELRVSQWYLVDLPGYGYAKISQSSRRRWEQMIENYLRKRENLCNVFILIDSRHQPQKIDLDFINKLGEWQIPFTLIFTKTDKEKSTVVHKHITAFLNEMRNFWEFLPQHFATSAINKRGREELLAFIEKINHEFYQTNNKSQFKP